MISTLLHARRFRTILSLYSMQRQRPHNYKASLCSYFISTLAFSFLSQLAFKFRSRGAGPPWALVHIPPPARFNIILNMVAHRSCEWYALSPMTFIWRQSTDVFYVLNAVRVLSIIALLLVFASSIVMMVEDVKAVNDFINGQQTTNTSIFDSDYIEYVLFVLHTDEHLPIL